MHMSILTIAAIADIHGNSWALEAVLQDIERRGISHIVNLGDSLLGPLDPVGTAERLMQLNIPSIRGNDDRVIFDASADATEVSESLRYTQGQLSETHIAWLRSLPASRILFDEIFLCHGTPTSDEVYLLEKVTPQNTALRSQAELENILSTVEQNIVLCAHSHLPRTIYLTNSEGKTTLIINPGSVGMPAYQADFPYPHAMESGSPHAKYAILTRLDGLWYIEHVLVPYAWEKAVQAAQTRGRDDWAWWLKSGKV
jgi:predicted phosphodiesterase